jgi:hypothetical protein
MAVSQKTFALAFQAGQLIRPPSSIAEDANGDPVIAFDPPLTPTEQTLFNDLAAYIRLGVTTDLSLVEFQAIKPDLVTARQYVGLASPTAAQTTSALKSAIRVLGALLRQ